MAGIFWNVLTLMLLASAATIGIALNIQPLGAASIILIIGGGFILADQLEKYKES